MPIQNPGPAGTWLARWHAWAARAWGRFGGRQRFAVRRTLAERSTFPTSVHAADGHVVWANAAFDRLCGRPRGGCVGARLGDLLGLGADDAAALERLCQGTEDGRVVVAGRAPGGARLSLQAEVLQLPPQARAPGRALVHWFDQTEHLRTQERLQSVLVDLSRERERLGHILAGTQVGAWEINLVTGEARMDDAWAALFGWRRAELEPWSRPKAREMLHPDDRSSTDEQVRRHLACELPAVDIEQRVLHRSGEWVWVHSRGKVATWTPDGRPEWLAGSHMDIRERKRQQAALEAQRAYMRSVLSSLPGVVFEFEADERGDFRLTWLSDALRSMFGIEPDDALRYNQLLFATVPAEDMASLREVIATSARQMTLLEHQYRITMPSGRQRWLGVHAQPSQRADGTRCLHGMLLDLTRRHELSRQLAQAREAAEEASRAKSAFLATMSHEIRSPMNGVLGMTDVLMSAASPEDQADAVQTIRDSAHALLRLIDDILDFSKIEAGRLDLEQVPLNPGQLLESVAEAQASSSAAEGVALAVHLAPDLPETVLGDPTRLRQVVVNLASNAIKFSRRDAQSPGRVRLALQRTDVPACGLLLRVEDEGIGMDESTVARLFQPFVQADASTTRRYGGTGLGLAIVSRLVDAMQGRIEVRSRPGAGTRFDVWLPLEPVAAAPERAPARLADVRCVLVGHAPADADALQAVLRLAGAEVVAWPDLDTLAQCPALAGGGRVVVVLPHRGEVADLLPRLGTLRQAAGADLRFLLLAPQGRPQPLQIVAPEVGVARVLRRQALWRAVAALAGQASPELPAPRPPWVPAAGDDRMRAAAGQRQVLVVDDDPTNRKVAQRQLQLLGLGADLAANGEEGLVRWRAGRPALVLTDLHMPGLDGYAFARRLRAEEAAEGRTRTPVLALTANALRGEELRAREAGIDAVLTKPIALDALHAALARWLGEPPAATPASTPAPAPGAVLDLDVLRGLVGDEPEVIAEFLAEFRRSFEAGRAAITAALAGGDTAALAAAAHKLKSAARAVGALPFASVCDRLERHAGDDAQRAAAGRDFQAEADALTRALDPAREATP